MQPPALVEPARVSQTEQAASSIAMRQDVGGPGGVARGEAHLAHGVDHRPRVVGGDVDVLDGLGEQLGLGVGGAVMGVPI